ncbi:TPA: hypothetical protein MIT98_27985 [Klebsiella pneumoniae]|nr:hypothetical protein DMQ68_27345 [Klebsiella pneumoniae]PXI19618.1 hypothetical protein DMQ07_27220 [Klebsiella pneumoniae]PZX82837.1 hypothetical protein DMR06_24320 [Klebsiella pneumoniae]QDX63809.1 hypothetical protein DPF99_00915 [Klebsiella pneumoniae]HBY4233996.1 hypothetical protein [Klebsiella pneumoniae]
MRAVRAAYERVLQNLMRGHLKRLIFLVTTSIIKSDVFRPFGPGGGAFQWWGGALGRQTGAGFMMNIIMNAVTNLILRSGPVAERWELLLSERRGRVRPL